MALLNQPGLESLRGEVRASNSEIAGRRCLQVVSRAGVEVASSRVLAAATTARVVEYTTLSAARQTFANSPMRSDCAGALVDDVTETADQPEDEDEPQRGQPVRTEPAVGTLRLLVVGCHSCARPRPAAAAAAPTARLAPTFASVSSSARSPSSTTDSQPQVEKVV